MKWKCFKYCARIFKEHFMAALIWHGKLNSCLGFRSIVFERIFDLWTNAELCTFWSLNQACVPQMLLHLVKPGWYPNIQVQIFTNDPADQQEGGMGTMAQLLDLLPHISNYLGLIFTHSVEFVSSPCSHVRFPQAFLFPHASKRHANWWVNI